MEAPCVAPWSSCASPAMPPPRACLPLGGAHVAPMVVVCAVCPRVRGGSCRYDANRYFNANQPWLLKRGAAAEDTERLNAVLWHVLECARVAGLLLHPVMPHACSRLLAYLGIETPPNMQGAAALARVGAGPASLTVGGAPQHGPGKFVLFPPTASSRSSR